jgi:hypothetical protein
MSKHLSQYARPLPMLGLVAMLWPSFAHSQSGEWKTKLARNTIDVKSWGTDCGTRPKAKATTAKKLYDSKNGVVAGSGHGHLLFGPGVCRSATGQPDLTETQVSNERITCKSKPKAAIEINGRVVKRLKGGQIDVAHRFEYKWKLLGSQCHRIDRGRWSLTRAGASRKEKPLPKNKAVDCRNPGSVRSLKTRGTAAFGVEPGEATHLRIDATDVNGCSVPARVRWSTTKGKIDGNGNLDTRGLKPGLLKVTGRVGNRSKVFRITVLDGEFEDGLAPKFSPFDPNKAMQVQDQQIQHGIVVTTKVSAVEASQDVRHTWIFSAAGFGLGLICLIIGLRKRKQGRIF